MKENLIKTFTSLLLLVIFINSCNFYKPVTKPLTGTTSDKVSMIDSLSNRTIILHSNQGVFLIKNFIVNEESESILGFLAEVPEDNQRYLQAKGKKYNYKNSEPEVLREAHIYTGVDLNNLPVNIGDQVNIPLNSINKLEVIERDKKRSSENTVFTVLGVTAGALVVAGTITVLTSCPFISAYDGQEFVLQGESFGGAVYPSLAREDFIPLPALDVGREMKVMIHNELKERQYNDFADLIMVSHLPGEQVVVDPNGNLKIVKQKIGPSIASLNQDKDVLPRLTESDNFLTNFNELEDESAINQILVGFDYPRSEYKPTLYLNLRNTYWLDHLFGEFTSKFGSKHVTWQEKQRERPAEELLAWQESQYMPLAISVKTKGGWKEVQKLKTIGPLINREVAISLEGFEIEGPTVEIALTTGFMFWEIDQVALVLVEEVSPNSIKLLKPNLVLDENGNDVIKPLLEKDGVYLEQLEMGNRAYISYYFDAFNPNKHYTAFLHTSGYYEPIRDFKGKPDRKFLTKFKKPGTLPKYSRFKYLELTGDTYLGAK
ncbi:hypothetical protein [Shivajiella indica]|uniref:Lipoprotein n=1 Tax=Shivajiella indica TaxID=872115 RepID=A0ABW5B801_9BACT